MHVWDQLRCWWRSSLRHRLLASSVATILSALLLLGYLSFRIGQAGIRREVNQRNDQLAMLIAKDINAQLDNIWGNVRLFAYQLEASADLLPLQAQAMLELRRAAPLTYRALYLFDGGGSDSKGRLLIHLSDPVEALLAVQDIRDIVERPPIPVAEEVSIAYQAAKSGSLFLSATYLVGVDQVPVLYMSAPVTTRQKPNRQIIVAEIDLRSIWRRIDEIHIEQTGRAFVVSRDGTIVAHPDRAYIGQPVAPALRQVLAGYKGQTEYVDPYAASERVMLASYSPVGGRSGWGIVVEQERREAFAYARAIAFTSLGILLVAVLVTTALTAVIARGVTRPIQQLAESTQAIAQTGDLSQNIDVESEDEVGQLAASFNQMIASLREAEATLKTHSEQLEARVEERTQALRDAQEQLVRREKLAVLGQLASGVGHELRNPLGVISNAIYFLRTVLLGPRDFRITHDFRITRDSEIVDNEVLREYLDIIALEVKNSVKIVSDLLDFARSRLPAREATSVTTLAAEVLQASPPQAEVRVLTDIPPDLPWINVDSQQIALVLTNLISNAYQAMPEGGTLTLRARFQNGKVKVAVVDTGCGIASDNLSKLFEPLFTTKPRGIGLGLAISKNLVEANDGRITVQSEEGKGSTFILILPVKEVLE